MFACEICDRQFYYKNSVNRHFRREHINKESRRRLKCTECDHECRFYQDLRTHIYVDHGIVCKVERRTFINFEEFKKWKRKYEETSHYMYVKHSSSKVSTTSNERKTYFVCHRTGTFQSGSCGKRKLKRQGSNKINASCPSTMEVVESLSDETVKLVLWKTHVGHNAEISRTFLSTNERNWLAARISEGASYQKIMDEIQTMGSKGGRMCFIKSQDIRNMRKNLINKRNRNILFDIRSWVRNVQDIKNNDSCPIIYFKDRNVSDPKKILSNKDLMLIIMTKFQEKLLKDLGSKILCLDATHCQENYEYQLLTIYTSDGNNWCPVVYCLTNIVNFTSVHYFLKKVNEKNVQLRCRILLSDDNLPFYDAWCDIISKPEHHFIHSWCIEKNWRENISKMKCTDNVKMMFYKSLKIMMNEPNEKTFEKMLNNFLSNFQYDTRFADFLSYFQKKYIKGAIQWANCYRKQSGVHLESSIELEQLHKRLYEEFHQSVNSQKIKDCLNFLLVISNNCKVMSKKIMDIFHEEYDLRFRCIRDSHRRAVCIKRTEISEITPTLYKVNVDNLKNEIYQIHYLDIKKCSCLFKCNTCKICAHEYNCTCVDYAINFNICEHIHACAILRNKINVDLSAETDAPLDSFVEEVICEEEIVCNVDNLYEDSGCEEISCDEIDDDEKFITLKSENMLDDDVNSDNEQCFSFEKLDEMTLKEENEQELNFDEETALYYEPFAFVGNNEIKDYGQEEFKLTDEGCIVTFQEECEYEAVFVNDDDSSFGDTSSVYEDMIPSKGAIIALGFGSESSDNYIFRRFDDNTIIRHKVDSLFTLTEFENVEDNDISIQFNSDIDVIEAQDFQDCYSSYDPVEEDSIVLNL